MADSTFIIIGLLLVILFLSWRLSRSRHLDADRLEALTLAGEQTIAGDPAVEFEAARSDPIGRVARTCKRLHDALLSERARITKKAADLSHHQQLEDHLRYARNHAELLSQLGLDLVGEMDISLLTQRVTDTARALVEAESVALFYNTKDHENAETSTLYAVSGMLVADFRRLCLARSTALIGPVFTGEGTVRCADVTLDPRFGRSDLDPGPNVTNQPIVSCLAVPVRTRSGVVIGVLFCSHSLPGQFTLMHERLLRGIAALAATAFDSARLIEAERWHKRLADRRSAELMRSNAELEQFAYICSHDLQEPLRMVTSFLGLVEERYHEPLDERGRGYIRRAIESASRMQRMVRDVLSYSRVGRGERAQEVFSLELVLDEALANLQMAIKRNGARIERSVLPTVRGNRLQLVQLFQNLIGNALKFRGESPPVIRIEVVDAGTAWRFTVTDNGIGIDPAHHQRIFQVFQRLHGRERFEGTGIGLSLCQKIVAAHGGNIGLTSNLGGGASFWFSLPHGLTSEPTPNSGQHPALPELVAKK